MEDKPGSSFMAGDVTNSANENTETANFGTYDRLQTFVSFFVSQFEVKLTLYSMILEGSMEHRTKTAEMLGDGGGSVVGLLIGLVVAGSTAGASVGGKIGQKVANSLQDKFHKKKVAKLSELVENFLVDKEEYRKALVKAGFDIFQSFEMQFAGVTTDYGHRRALRNLATDAVDRALNFVGDHNVSIAEAVLRGKSKVQPLWGVPIPTQTLKTPGFQIEYQYVSGKKTWNTASLFEKVGVVKFSHSDISYYEDSKKSRTIKYGFRRLLLSENWDDMKATYVLSRNKASEIRRYRYILMNENCENILQDILKNIDQSNCDLIEKRIQNYVEEAKCDIVTQISDLIKHFTESKETFTEILESVQNFNTASCVEKFEIYLNEIQMDLKEIKDDGKETKKYAKEIIKEVKHIKESERDITGDIKEVKEKVKAIHKKLTKINPDLFKLKNNTWFNVRAPVKCFVGRIEELDRIHTLLQTECRQVSVMQTVAISGLGGIGKSELARQYAYTKKEFYDNNVIWIDAETHENIEGCFRNFALSIKNITPNSPSKIFNESKNKECIENVLKYSYQYFKQNKSLFIFDNVEEYKTVCRYLPSGNFLSPSDQRPHVLITSRNQEWDVRQEGDLKHIVLHLFTPEEAADFIKKSLGTDYTDSELSNLARELQYLPLALEQAAAYIRERNASLKLFGNELYTIQDYISEFQKGQQKFLEFKPRNQLDRYIPTVYTTWDITFKRLRDAGEIGLKALDAFNTMAYLPPEYIVWEINSFINSKDKGKQQEAMELLHRYSMINLTKGRTSVHRLVQQVVRIKLQEQGNEEHVLRDLLTMIGSSNTTFNNRFYYVNNKRLLTYVWENVIKYDDLIWELYLDKLYGSYNPLFDFARMDKMQSVKRIIESLKRKSPDKLFFIINDCSSDGDTLLLIAISLENVELTQHLLQNGAKVLYGYLQCAVLQKSVEIFKCLYKTIMSTSPESRYYTSEFVLQFCYRKEPPIMSNSELKIISSKLVTIDDTRSSSETLKPLVETNILNVPFVDGYTLIHHAAMVGSLELVKYMLDCGADVIAASSQQMTEILQKHTFDVRVSKNEDFSKIDVENIFSNTLDYCKEKCFKNQILTMNDKKIFYRDTPLHVAVWKCLHLCITYFNCNTCKTDLASNIIEQCSGCENKDTSTFRLAKYLIEEGANLKACNNNGETPFHIAARFFSLELMQHMIEQGANINEPNIENQTPLHLVCLNVVMGLTTHFCMEYYGECDHPNKIQIYSQRAVKFLVESGADLKLRDVSGNTPLHYAVMHHGLDITKYLVDKGADVNARNKDGVTPLYNALRTGSIKKSNFLVEEGADLAIFGDGISKNRIKKYISSGSFKILKNHW